MKLHKQTFMRLGALMSALTLSLAQFGASGAAPTITGTGQQQGIFDDQTRTVFQNVTISDGDNDQVRVAISFPAERGVLTSLGSFSFSSGSYNLGPVSPAAATTAIKTLAFSPATNRIILGTTEITTFTVMVTDTNNLSITNNDTLIEVTPRNDSPYFTGGLAATTMTDKQTNQPFATMAVFDFDNYATQTVNLQIEIDNPAKGMLTNGSLASFTPVSSNRWDITGTPTAVSTALSNLFYRPTENRRPVGSNEVTTFTLLLTDSESATLQRQTTATVTSISTNDPPILGGAVAGVLSVRSGFALNLFPSVFISDLDPNPDPSKNSQNVTLEVTLRTNGGNNVVIGGLTPPGGGATSFTLTDASAQEATLALQQLVYAPFSAVPAGTTNRMNVRIRLTDSAGASLTNDGTSIDLYTPLTPPGLSGTVSDQRVRDKETIAPFSTVTVQSLNGSSFGVDIQLDPTKGQLVNLVGFTATAGNPTIYSFRGTSEAATAAMRQLLFRPIENKLSGSSTELVGFGISLLDSGTTNGPDFSTTVIVSPVNDVPRVNGIAPQSTINDNQTIAPFPVISITDVDQSGTQQLSLTIWLDNDDKGSFESASLGAVTKSGTNYLFNGSPAQATLALQGLVFKPTQNRLPIGESETTIFNVGINDGHGGNIVDSRSTVRVLSVAGAPEIQLPQPQPVSRILGPPLLIFESVRILDDETLTVTITQDSTNSGVFSTNTLVGWTNLAPGQIRYFGTEQQVSNALAIVIFQPNTNLPPRIIHFSMDVVDATGNPVSAVHAVQLRAERKAFVVTKTTDYDESQTDPAVKRGTLRKAVEDAGSNDRITVDIQPAVSGVLPLPATIRLKRQLVVNKNLTFEGPGAESLTISGDTNGDGTPDVPLFQVNALVTMHGFTLSHGKAGFAGGAIRVTPGAGLEISHCAIVENEADQWGGGIDVEAGSLFMDHCLVADNKTSGPLGKGGGGLSIYSDYWCRIENTTFSGNHQQSPSGLGGGGLYVENLDPGSPLVVEVIGCTFAANLDEANGGTSIRPNVFNSYVMLANSIVADGQGKNLEVDGSGMVMTLGGNISDDSTRTIFSFGGDPYEVVLFEPPFDKTNASPKLLSLALNFGRTANYNLNFNSPALAAARTNELGTDQRGFWRDSGPDSGAVERDGTQKIIISEIQFDPVPNTNDEFIEFYVPRSSTAVDLSGCRLYIGGELKHTFAPRVVQPGNGIVLFSSGATTTNMPPDVAYVVSANFLDLDSNADSLRLVNSNGLELLYVTYVGSFSASDPAITNLLTPHQSVNLSPEFTGVFVPFGLAYTNETGQTPPTLVSSPGRTVAGIPLSGGNAPATAYDDYFTLTEDTITTLDVLANDRDLDITDTLQITSVSSTSALGGILISQGTNLFYNPTLSPTLQALTEGGSAVDMFWYSIIDCCDTNGTNWAAIGLKYFATNYLTVLGVNDPPIPAPDYGSNNAGLRTPEDLELDINVAGTLLGNDGDPDTDDDNTTLQIASVHTTSSSENTLMAISELGAVVTLEIRFNRDQTRILYDPRGSSILNALSQGETTNDVFYYTLQDRHGAVGVARVEVLVTGRNDGPTAFSDILATDEDHAITVPLVQLLSNDLDPDTDDNGTTPLALQVVALSGQTSLVTTSALGAVVSVVSTNLLYDPSASALLRALSRKEIIADSFLYTVRDPDNAESTASVAVTVTGVNDTPIAAPDSYVVGEDTLSSVLTDGVLGNDIDYDKNGSAPDDKLRVISATNVSTFQGAKFTIQGNGSFAYDARGVFDYLKQGMITNDTFTYTVVDDSYTIANNDSFSVFSDSTNVSLPVLANDVTLTGTGGSLFIQSYTEPDKGGTLILNSSSNAFVYAPAINFYGVETFTYRIEDGQGGWDVATVLVIVTTPVRNGNLAANSDAFTVPVGTTARLDVLLNDNTLPAQGSELSILSVTTPVAGGQVSIIGSAPNSLIEYQPATNAPSYPYTETFEYVVSGGASAESTATVTVTVVDRRGALPVNQDVFTVIAGGSNNSLDVLANDRVVPGSTTNLSIVAIETNGVSGQVWIHSTGNRLVYTPPAGATNHVEAVFYYVAADSSGGTGTGSVLVAAIQKGVVANDDYYIVSKGSTNSFTVLSNDAALPNVGQNLVITAIGLGSNAPSAGGSVAISGTAKTLVYSPSPTNTTGVETFTYEISDGTLARGQGRVRVRIEDRTGKVNVNTDAFSVARESTNNVLRVLANDNLQPESLERLTITGISATPANGTARVEGVVPNQVVYYAPRTGFVGEDTFTYAVEDNRGGTGIATARVKVGYLTAGEDTFTVLSGSFDNFLDVQANDQLLPAVTPLRPVVSVGPASAGGLVAVAPGGAGLLYTPATNFGDGVETLTYQTADDSGTLLTGSVSVRVLPAGGDRDTETVTVTVVGTNDAPTITGAAGGWAITDKETLMPFSGVTVADVDEYSLEQLTVTISLDDAAKGVLLNLGGFAASIPGSYVMTGTGAEVTTAIRQLVFDPTENRITVPTTELTVFTISALDGYVSSPVTNSDTTVAVTAVNDPPVVSGTVPNQTVYHLWTIRPFSSATITEADDLTLQPLVVTVTVSSLSNGFLTALDGFVDLGGGVYRLGSSGSGVKAAAASQALRNLVFVPTTAGRVTPGAAEVTGFSIAVEDGFAAPVIDTNTTVVALHEFATKITANDGATSDGFGSAVAANHSTVVVGAPLDDDKGNGSGAAYVFVWPSILSTQWVQFQKLVPADSAAGNEFGGAVSISGNTMVVGSRFHRPASASSGVAYVYELVTNAWVQVRKLSDSTGANGDEFGGAVCVDGDTIVVGAHADDDSGSASGTAFVFSRNLGGSNNWGLVRKLIADDAAAGDEFGSAVCVSGNTILIGSPLDTHNGVRTGSAYVFTRAGTNWIQTVKLIPSDGAAADSFGASVSIEGSSIVVGARTHDQLGNDVGAAYLFWRDQNGPGNWGQVKELLPPTVLNNDQFGYSVSLSRDKSVVGVPFAGFDNQSKYGTAYAYARNQGGTNNWGALQKLERPDPANNDQFGISVSIGQDTVVIGVNGDDDRGNESGSAYIYRLKYNNAPRLVHPLADVLATNGVPFLLALASDTFADSDVGDRLSFSADLQDGSPLPAWLSFHPATLTFSGIPNLSAVYYVRVRAVDEDGFSAVALFSINVSGGTLIVGYQTPLPVLLTLIRDPQDNTLWVAYLRPVGAEDGESRLEASADLQAWQSASDRVLSKAVVPVSAELEQIVLQLNVNSQSSGEYFRIARPMP